MSYTPNEIQQFVLTHLDELFAPWKIGRPENWIPDKRTVELVSTAYYVRSELQKLNVSDDDRKTQENYFYRHSRSDENIYELASHILNDAVEGKIEKNRRTHRRWG